MTNRWQRTWSKICCRTQAIKHSDTSLDTRTKLYSAADNLKGGGGNLTLNFHFKKVIESNRHFLQLPWVFVCFICVEEKAVVIWVWNGGHKPGGWEGYYYHSVDPARSSSPPPPLPPPLSWHSNKSGSVFPTGFLCRSAGRIAQMQQAQLEEMVKVHPKYTKLDAALCCSPKCFRERNI